MNLELEGFLRGLGARVRGISYREVMGCEYDIFCSERQVVGKYDAVDE